MRALAGGVAAVITIVLVFFGFGLRGNSQADARQAAMAQSAMAQPAMAQPAYVQAAPDARVQPMNGFTGGAQVVPVSAAQNEGWQQAAGQQPMLVNCGPGTQTLVRQAWINGQAVSQVECLGAANGVVYPQQQVRTVAYESPVYDARMSRAPVYQSRPAARRIERPRRSWQKTALVIGGSTAGGAGLGALIGGKKGALIGAALGGGASTIYEATKRR